MADINAVYQNEQIKQQQRMATMRAAQVAQQAAGQEMELGSSIAEPKGSRKQLIGTIVGIGCVVLLGVILQLLGVI